MIDTQSDPGSWATELERLGTRAPGQQPPARTFIEAFFRARRADPRFSLGEGDLRLTSADQAMLVAFVRRMDAAVKGAPKGDDATRIPHGAPYVDEANDGTAPECGNDARLVTASCRGHRG